MKLLTSFLLLFILTQDKKELKNKIVEISCGQCQFGITDKQGCDLAIRHEGKVYFVKKAKIDDFGDAHAKNGFCNAIRTAKVSGVTEENLFADSKIKLIEDKK